MRANSDVENMYETMNTIGWDKLCERWAERFEGVNQVFGCSSEKEMYIRQGQLMILQELLTAKEDMKAEMNEVVYPSFDEVS